MRTGRALSRSSRTLVVVLALFTLVAAGCGLAPTHAPSASDQWSNGKFIGSAILNTPVGLQVDEAGHSYIVWVGLEHRLTFAHLNERAEEVTQKPLDLSYNSPQKPQLLRDSTGQLHLIWLDRRERGLQLFYARFSAKGEVVQKAITLSPPEQKVTHSVMVLDPVGQTVEIFWSDDTTTRPGCYHAALDWSGTVVVPAEVLVSDGLLPTAQIDRRGFVHLAWRVALERTEAKPRFHYAVYDPHRRVLGSDTVVAEPRIQASLLGGPTAGATIEGPWLGLDEQLVYLAWVMESRERGNVRDFTFYQAFPQPALRSREESQAFSYLLPEVTDRAVHVRDLDPSMTGHPRFLEDQPAHQVLACFTQVSGPANLETLQIATVDLQAGRIEGQRVINASRGASLRPSVVVDLSGNLHLVWIDTAGFNRYQVVYASTAPQVKATLNRVTTYEVVDKVLSGVMGAFSVLFFVPIVFAWALIPIGWLAIFTLTTGQFDIPDPRGRIAIGVAMLLHLGAKLLLFPGLLCRLPFNSHLAPLLTLLVGRWVFPLFLAIISAGLVWAYSKRAHSQSIFKAYFIYAAVDSLLTLIIYVAPLTGYL